MSGEAAPTQSFADERVPADLQDRGRDEDQPGADSHVLSYPSTFHPPGPNRCVNSAWSSLHTRSDYSGNRACQRADPLASTVISKRSSPWVLRQDISPISARRLRVGARLALRRKVMRMVQRRGGGREGVGEGESGGTGVGVTGRKGRGAHGREAWRGVFFRWLFRLEPVEEATTDVLLSPCFPVSFSLCSPVSPAPRLPCVTVQASARPRRTGSPSPNMRHHHHHRRPSPGGSG